MANRPDRLGVWLGGIQSQFPTSKVTDLPLGHVLYRYVIKGNPAAATFQDYATAMLDAGVAVEVLVEGAEPVSTALIDNFVAIVSYDSRITRFIISNEIGISDGREQSYFGVYYPEIYAAIHAAIPNAEVAPAGLADGLLSSVASGNAASGAHLQRHFDLDSEYLAAHHHSLPNNINFWWPLLTKQMKPIDLTEAGQPDPRASGVSGDNDAIDALVETEYVPYVMRLLMLHRLRTYYHFSSLDNETGNRFDGLGLFKQDGTAKPALTAFQEVARRVQQPGGASHRPAWNPRGRSLATVGRRSQ